MGLFSRKDKVVDLTDKYHKDQEKIQEFKENLSEAKSEENNFGFFGNFQPTPQPESEDSEERKKKLAKRLMEITDKLEEVSNKLYHIEQRLELIERKMNLNSGY